MAKLSHLGLRTCGLWALALVAVLASWGPAGNRLFAQGPAAKPNAVAPKKAPKAAATKPVKKAKPAKAVKAVPSPALPPKEKIPPITGNLRDPFRLPEPPKVGAAGGIDTGPRPPGPRGLTVGEMLLEGIVREDASKTMIAVVAGPERRAYFLRINDPVYHATVSKITTDSVYFTETFTDPAGHEGTREVVKKMPATGEKP